MPLARAFSVRARVDNTEAKKKNEEARKHGPGCVDFTFSTALR